MGRRISVCTRFQGRQRHSAQLVFKIRTVRRLTPLHPVIINIHSRFAPERLRVEGFIKDIYRRSYGADISVIYTNFGEGNYAPTENDIRFLLTLDSKTEATMENIATSRDQSPES